MPPLVDNPPPPLMTEAADISIFDESLIESAAKPYTLFCTVDRQFIGLSVVDMKERKFYAFEGYHFPQGMTDEQLAKKISSLASQSDILKKVDFTVVSVQVVNRNYTFVPSVLYRQEDIELYYFINHRKDSGVEIRSDAALSYDLVNIFSVPETVLAALKKIFERFTCHHHVSSLLEAIRMENHREEQKNLSLHFHSGYMDVIVTEGRKLVLCNTFSYKSAEDALYYVLFVCEQLFVNLEKIAATIYGELEKESALHRLLGQYVRNISFSRRPKHAAFSYGFDAIPEHFYFSVFSQVT